MLNLFIIYFVFLLFILIKWSSNDISGNYIGSLKKAEWNCLEVTLFLLNLIDVIVMELRGQWYIKWVM